MDGKLLARAREALERRKEDNARELDRRRAEVYACLPEVREMDNALRALMGELVASTLGRGGRTPEELERESLDIRARKAEFMAEHGYPIEYIDENDSCKVCHDTGYVRGRMCACLKELYRAETRKNLSALLLLGDESFANFRLDYYDDAPDSAGVVPRQVMGMIFNNCRAFAATFGEASPNLLFSGGTGLGKTYLSACIAREVSEKGFSVVYETAFTALGDFEKQKFARGEDAAEVERRVRRYLECDLMILDDLGTEMVTNFSVSALYTLINSRLTAGKKTIISTNLTEEGVAKLYSPQILSRLQGEYLWLRFAGRDIRAIRKDAI